MKNKIIYVDFIKKRKINFIHFIIYRIVYFVSNKFKTSPKQEINNNKKKRIFS